MVLPLTSLPVLFILPPLSYQWLTYYKLGSDPAWHKETGSSSVAFGGRADRAGANGGWVGGVGGCATVRHGKAKSPLREQKENPHHCNCSAPSQPLVWPSTCTPYLTTHRSCFLILLQKEFERMYYHSWGETESRSAFLDVLFILLLGVSRAKFPLLSDPEHRSKGKKDPVFVVCIFRLPPLRTYIQQ